MFKTCRRCWQIAGVLAVTSFLALSPPTREAFLQGWNYLRTLVNIATGIDSPQP